MPGEMHITGFMRTLSADSGDGGTTQDETPLVGLTGSFIPNIGRTKPVPFGGGLYWLKPRDWVIGEDGQFYEILDDGSTAASPGITLTANDPGFELTQQLQWRCVPNTFTLGGRSLRLASWWFNAEAPGWTGTIDELTPVPGVNQDGGTRGLRGLRTYAVPVTPGDPDTLYQWQDENGNNVGEPVELSEIVNVAWDALTDPPAVIAAGSTQAAARAAIGALAPEDVDAVVVAAIAADGTVVAATVTSVDAYVSGELNLVRSNVEPDDDGDIVKVDDVQGRKAFRIDEDGVTHAALPNLAGVPMRSHESARGWVSMYWAEVSPGVFQPCELVVDENTGMVPDWVLERWKVRSAGWSGAARDWIVVCGGQSNMDAGDDAPPLYTYDTDPRLVQYDRDNGTLQPVAATEPGLWCCIGRELLRRAPSDVRIILLRASLGGTGFRTSSIEPPPEGYDEAFGTWDRTLTEDPNNLYVRMVDDIDAILELPDLATDHRIVGFFGSYGEADAGGDVVLTQSEYAAVMDDMIDAFRDHLGMETLPVVLGGMVPEWVGSTSERLAVQRALMDTPRRVLNSAFVYGPFGQRSADRTSGIHYATSAAPQRAAMFADALHRAHFNTLESRPVSPQIRRVVRSGDAVTVELDSPANRHTEFVVEYSTDGSTWTAMTKPDGVIGLSATATISAGTAIQVRACTNSDSTSGTTTSFYTYATA
jgi:Carbohydrate esterase, sialic acid-specific acetylesterase